MEDDKVNALNSQSLGLRIQKKIASKMSNKNMAKIFIDETTGRILDNLFFVVKEYTNSRSKAEKIMNDIIKIIVKVGLLVKNNQLNDEEIQFCNDFRNSFHYMVKTGLSFYEVHYTYEYAHMKDMLQNCESTIQKIVKPHLTDKSKQRIEHTFTFFSNQHFLESVFKDHQKYGSTMEQIVKDVRKLVDEGSL